MAFQQTVPSAIRTCWSHPKTFPPAVSLLEEVGYRPAPGQELEKVERFLDTSPGLAGNKAITLYGPQNSEIDLHWSVGFAGVPPKVMIERSDTTALFGSKIRVPSAIDAMMLTARHSMRENFAIDKIARDLLDLRLWCDKLERDGSLGRVLEAMHRLDRATPVLAMARILAVYAEDSAAAHAVSHTYQSGFRKGTAHRGRAGATVLRTGYRRADQQRSSILGPQPPSPPDLCRGTRETGVNTVALCAPWKSSWKVKRCAFRSAYKCLAEAVKSTNLRQFSIDSRTRAFEVQRLNLLRLLSFQSVDYTAAVDQGHPSWAAPHGP